jgi:hypothetical protein
VESNWAHFYRVSKFPKRLSSSEVLKSKRGWTYGRFIDVKGKVSHDALSPRENLLRVMTNFFKRDSIHVYSDFLTGHNRRSSTFHTTSQDPWQQHNISDANTGLGSCTRKAHHIIIYLPELRFGWYITSRLLKISLEEMPSPTSTIPHMPGSWVIIQNTCEHSNSNGYLWSANARKEVRSGSYSKTN